MAEKVYYRGEGDENTFHNSEVNRLRTMEDAAGDNFSEFSQGDYNSEMENRRKAEEEEESGYWRGQGRSEEDKKKRKKRMTRRMLPILIIVAGMFGMGGLSFMSSTLGPFAFIGNALDQFNVMRTSMNRRSTYFMRFQMDESLNTGLTKKRFGIFGAEKFRISNKMQKKLAVQGIEYNEDPDTNARYLVYTNPETGEVSTVVANERDFKTLSGKSIENGKGKTSSKLMMMDDMLADEDFFVAHKNATMTVKGHIVGWFESLTESFHNRIKASRNRFFGTTDETDEEEVKQKAKKTGMSEDIQASEGSAKETEEEVDENGKKKKLLYNDDGTPEIDPDTGEQKFELVDPETKEISGSDGLKNGDSPSTTKSALTVRAEKAAAIAGTASGAQGIVCGVINALSAINIVITGIQVAKTLNFVTGAFEAVQRTQIGDGGSEMMVYYNDFAESKETEVWDGENENIEKRVVSNKSTMASTAYNSFFGGPDVDSNDESAMKFNRDYATTNALRTTMGDGEFANNVASMLGTVTNAASSLTAYKACLYSGMALNTIGVVIDVAMIIFTGGIGNAIKSFVGGLVKAAVKAAIMLAVGLFIAWVVPKVAQWLATDLIENIGGEDAANALRSGANIYMGKSMEANSGAVGDKEAVLAMYRETQEILAEDARYDRATRSPLDPTSKYTFVGSLVQKLMPVGNMLAGNSLLGAIGSMVSGVGTSMLSILPSASAASETWYDLALKEDCPNLSGLNLVGDAYCNPYYTSDMSTIAMNPYDVVRAVGDDQFEDGEVENPAIKKDSELGKYVVACTLRDTQYGVKDAAVMSWIENPTGNSTLNAVIDSGTGLIPVVGNIYDLAQQTSELSNMDWNTGQACIQNEEVNPKWSQYKYYQRYIEDQTLMEASGIIEESQVTAFVNEYYKEHPLDNSFEGVIARYSGLTKEEVEGVIALAEYINFLGEYDPSKMYPTPVEEHTVEISIAEPMFREENVEVASVRYVVYADLRGKVVAEA